MPKGLSTRRTSLIVDPPNGRIPPPNEQALARTAAARAARGDRGAFDGYEMRPHSERCLNYRYNAPPLQPPSYNDIHQIFQTPTHVVVFTEQSTNGPRIIPIDGRPALSDQIRQWPGDGRGRWEGDTLVVESSRFNDKGAWQGSSGSLKVVERFTRVADDQIHFTFTVEDSATWDQPWSAEIPLMATGGADVRVRLPRGQPRHPAHPGGLPQHRAPGGGRSAVAVRPDGRLGRFACAKLLRESCRRAHRRGALARNRGVTGSRLEGRPRFQDADPGTR